MAIDVYRLGIVTAPIGHPKNGAYDVTDVGIIDADSDVPANALGPIDYGNDDDDDDSDDD